MTRRERIEKMKTMSKKTRLVVGFLVAFTMFTVISAGMSVKQRLIQERFVQAHPLVKTVHRTVLDRVVVRRVVIDKTRYAPQPSSTSSNYSYDSSPVPSTQQTPSAPSAPSYSPPVQSSPAPAPTPTTSS